jgi:hypothetical protein
MILPIKFKFVSPKEIEDVVNSLKMKDSYGYDGISTNVLKQSITYISSPLTHICNLMISTGIFPTKLKFAEIKPLYKKGKIGNISVDIIKLHIRVNGDEIYGIRCFRIFVEIPSQP